MVVVVEVVLILVFVRLGTGLDDAEEALAERELEDDDSFKTRSYEAAFAFDVGPLRVSGPAEAELAVDAAVLLRRGGGTGGGGRCERVLRSSPG